MKELARISISKLFDSIIYDQGGNIGDKTIIYHSDCGFSFAGLWPVNYIPNYGYKSNANYYACPVCGKRSRGSDDAIAFPNHSDRVPIEITFRAIEYKDYIDLDMTFQTVYVDKDRESIDLQSGASKHRIRFDFKNRKTIYRVVKDRGFPANICDDINPFEMMAHGVGGPLDFLNGWSLIRKHKCLLNRLFKALRIAFERKLSQTVGYTIKDVYMPLTTSTRDIFCRNLIANMAWKLTHPDAPKLQTILTSLGEWQLGGAYWIADEVACLINGGMSYENAVLKHYANMNSPQLRNILKKYPGCFIHLSSIRNITDKPDLIVRTLEALYCQYQRSHWNVPSLVDQVDFWKAYAGNYGAVGAIRLIENYDKYDMGDSIRMYQRLERPYKKNFWEQKVKARNLHDTLMVLENKQDYADVNLPVVESLSDSTNGLQFLYQLLLTTF